MNRLIAQIKIDLREGNDSRLRIKKFSRSLRLRKLKQGKLPRIMLLQRRWVKELLARKRFDADSTQAAPIKNAHSFILQKSASFSQNAPTARDASTFTQTANLELSAQTKAAFTNTKAKERPHNR